MLQSMKQLGGPKKPTSKATPDQLKMAKRLKDIQSKQRNSPEGQQFMSELRLKNEEASKALRNKAAERKYISEMDMDARSQALTDRIENEKGEKVFGPEYKNLGLKRSTYKTTKGVESRYRNESDDDPESQYKEEVELVDPDRQILRVYRTGRMKDVELDPGQQRKRDYNRSPRGESATVYEETIKERAERLKSQKAARAKAIADKYAPIAEKARAEYEAKKAQEKAGGNK
jgi:hypothetical protein